MLRIGKLWAPEDEFVNVLRPFIFSAGEPSKVFSFLSEMPA
jgi:hypothetical protein